MPRKARSNTEKQEDNIRKIIKMQKVLYDISAEELAEILMVSGTCYRLKMAAPLDPKRGFRLGDVMAMDKVLHFTPEQKAKFVP